MLINKSNYEAYALDYIEGNLSDIEVREMELFLAAQPSIKAELEAMRELVTVTADESILFEPKELLLKEETAVVVWMRPRFRQRLAAGAAAIMLLTAGYFIGFKQGHEATETIANDTNTKIEEAHTPTPDTHEIANLNESEIINEDNSNKDKKAGQTEKTNVQKVRKTKPMNAPRPLHYEKAAPETVIASNEEQPATETNEKQEPLIVTDETSTPTPIAALALLPSKELQSVEIEITQIETVYLSNNTIAIVDKPRKRDRFRGLIGRLPFEDVSVANFVPTYYSDSGIGQ